MNSSNANTFLRQKCQGSVLVRSIKTTKMMTSFEILATFKDGHFSKEGHRKSIVSRTSMIGSPLPKSTLFPHLLDYTSCILMAFIWEERRIEDDLMTILCPKMAEFSHPLFLKLLLLKCLRGSASSGRSRGRIARTEAFCIYAQNRS